MDQEIQYTQQLGAAVVSNAIILGQVVGRVRGLEQVSGATTVKTDLIDGYLVENTELKGPIGRTEQIDQCLGENGKEVTEALQQIALISLSGASSTR